VKLLLDEMYPARLARALRQRGADAEGADERVPLRGLADEELLVVAEREGRALVSENVADFMRLYGEWAAAGRRHSGIVIALSLRFSRTPAAYGGLVDSLVDLCAARSGDEALADAVHFLVRS
jgi:hypothetical protein